jgi:AcrR family transcriptional regulator
MGKVDINKQRKKEALLNTAFDLFTSKGINDTSISDIVNKAGVAKGTFYLYFRDKYDIRNLLISHKSSQLFMSAHTDMLKANIDRMEDKIVFVINHIIDDLVKDKKMLNFISKNLSWGFFKKALMSNDNSNDVNFLEIYKTIINESEDDYKDPEIMLFMIIELVSSTCYSTILYSEPVSIEELKPYLEAAVRGIIRSHTTS